MFFNTVGWILIGICCFYILRNLYAGSILYPSANFMIQHFSLLMGERKSLFLNFFALRNYYLFVFNPFWWRMEDLLKNAEARKFVRDNAKSLRKLK